MGKMIVAVLTAMLIVMLAALPALGDEEIEYSPAGTPIKTSKPLGSGMNTTKPDDSGWISYGESARAADGSIRIVVDSLILDPDVKPFIDGSNRTLAPFRAIGEALGCEVEWSEADRKVTCKKEGFTVEMMIGNDTIWINGKPLVIDTAPQIKEDRTFIPVRALSEALACSVGWSEASLTVIVSSNGF